MHFALKLKSVKEIFEHFCSKWLICSVETTSEYLHVFVVSKICTASQHLDSTEVAPTDTGWNGAYFISDFATYKEISF